MSNQSTSARVIANADLRRFFQESIGDVLDKQGVKATGETVCYIVNVLTFFQHADRLEPRPLARLYTDALEERSSGERNRIMQRMGDVALFVSGVFSDSFPRRLVDIDYYIAMGSNAYAYLSESMRGSGRGDVFCVVFEELSGNFTRFVDVLSEVSDHARCETHRDVLHQYELWLRTGSRRARNRLRRFGIEPSAEGTGALGRTDH